MKEILLILAGAIGGFVTHSISMKVSFKQRTIENKIKVFDSIISHWVKMRNFIYANLIGVPNQNSQPQVIYQFDQIYGESQQLIGEAILVCEDASLTNDVNTLNEKLYRTDWVHLPLQRADKIMEEIKKEAMSIVVRMREDIKASTRLELRDFVHILWASKEDQAASHFLKDA
ncbi:MAG: hypothetical protein HYX72_03080 [Acidobacteria bacterium]|nr:hypothetical protein [Acidobacteriota bacterium]